MEEKDYTFLKGGGVMGERIRMHDWSKNPLGPISDWDSSLRLYLSQILAHRFPMLILWGTDLIQFHNDAFIPSLTYDLQIKPALGQKSQDYWASSWHLVKPMIDRVMDKGESIYNEDQPFPDIRSNGLTLKYWTFNYSPLRDENGKIAGMIVTSIDTTSKMESFQKMEEAEVRSRLTIDAAEMGPFEYNFQTREMFASEGHSHIMGIKGSRSPEGYDSIFHPEDLPIREAAHNEAIKNGSLDYNARIIRQGEIRWIQVKGKISYDRENNPQKLMGVILDITDKKLKDEEILLANKNLEIALNEQKELQKQKDEFLQVASHELRTPLTSIKGYAQLVEEILLEKGESNEAVMVHKLNEKIDQLHALIENLFDVSKVNSGRLDFKESVFDMVEHLRNIVDDLRFTTTHHQLIEEYDFRKEVRADKDRITQVITNLISNAIKYSPMGKNIRIRTRKFEDSMAVDIMDEGIGIPQEEREKVFDQFYRSKNLNATVFKGLGLGLYISAEIIQRQGGKIWVDKSSEKGTTFTFTLPIFEKALTVHE